MCALQGCDALYAESALRVFCLTHSSGNTARHRMRWWSSGCLRSCKSAFRSNSKLPDEFENANNVARAEQGAAATTEVRRYDSHNTYDSTNTHLMHGR
jgi:hypothetical protein